MARAIQNSRVEKVGFEKRVFLLLLVCGVWWRAHVRHYIGVYCYKHAAAKTLVSNSRRLTCKEVAFYLTLVAPKQ